MLCATSVSALLHVVTKATDLFKKLACKKLDISTESRFIENVKCQEKRVKMSASRCKKKFGRGCLK